MDTNKQNRAENYQINTFVAGMNTDTAYDLLPSNLYLFGQNIRITKNTLLGQQYDSNSTENIVCPVEVGKDIYFTEALLDGSSILATASINNVGAIITKLGDGIEDAKWKVYRAELVDDHIVLKLMFTSKDTTDRDRFSVVINKELEDHTKLYISDGKHQLMCIDLDLLDYYTEDFTEDDLISNHYFPTNQVLILKIIAGQLTTSQVLYTYRFYKKYGICSKLAPVTNKIQVISSERSVEQGNAYDTKTNIGFELFIPYEDDTVMQKFDHIQIYRLSYVKQHEPAEIDIVCDTKLINQNGFMFSDTGVSSLQTLTAEEYLSLYGTTIIPNILEQNQNYLFAANVQDETIKLIDYDAKAYRFDYFNDQFYTTLYKDDAFESGTANRYTWDDIKQGKDDEYIADQSANINQPQPILRKYDANLFNNLACYGGSGKNISWRFVLGRVFIDDLDNQDAPINRTDSDYSFLYLYDENNKPDTISSNIESYQYFENRSINAEVSNNYNDIFTSSLMRSLQRDEVYRYGIVFYDKHGIRTDVKWIGDIKTPDESVAPLTKVIGNKLYAITIGIEFKVKRPSSDIVGYQIVRCEKSHTYTKNLLLCALSRPVRQGKYSDKTYRSPYYPLMFLTTQFVGIFASTRQNIDIWGTIDYFDRTANNTENNKLYLIFSPHINVQRQTLILSISLSNCNLKPISYLLHEIPLTKELNNKYSILSLLAYVNDSNTLGNVIHTKFEGITNESLLENNTSFVHPTYMGLLELRKPYLLRGKDDKSSRNAVIKLYDRCNLEEVFVKMENDNVYATSELLKIRQIKDTKNPSWDQGFTNILLNGSNVINGIKSYKSFITSCDTETYVNWVCNGMYNLALCKEEAESQDGNGHILGSKKAYVVIGKGDTQGDNNEKYYRLNASKGWIGPGPLCFLISVDPSENQFHVLNNQILDKDLNERLGSIICNIQHTAVQYAGTTLSQLQYDSYCGFGNFSKFTRDTDSIVVFDGETYITPAEFVTLFKTYNFNDFVDTLDSSLVVYYVPMESKINTFFDYGMNYLNTSNTNLLLEPGAIEGIMSLSRPLCLYNMIYSDNSTSNEVFAASSLEDVITKYPQRIYYSHHKTNGEYIDSWHEFKPVDYIDADTRYGNITNLMTANDIIYYWLDTAFGKLSVNERSLVKDLNSNMILLGQGGVLNRTDYLSTKYGMRYQDFASILAEDTVFWIDIFNKAIIACSGQLVINYSELVNVQNHVNYLIQEDVKHRPLINYDLQNQELLCKMLLDDQQLVSNLKIKAITSVYTRKYDGMISFNNILHSLYESNKAIRLNYLENCNEYLSPTILEFVVNSSASQTKVFDNLKIVTMKRTFNEDDVKTFMTNRTYTYQTDINDRVYLPTLKEVITDREGNICYTIPRWGGEVEYGQRMRGKWMKERILSDSPKKEFSISHIITKFRLSFS